MTPKVSVCVPAYNAERFIGEAIAGVLAQTFADFELVVVDNASTDKTAGVVEGFRDPRVRLVRNASNIGFVRNLNRALREAKGEYAAFLCADDRWQPGFLAAALAALEANPAAAFAFAGASLVDGSGAERGVIPAPRAWAPGRVSGRDYFTRFFTSGGVALSGCLARRSALGDVGGFDESVSYSPDAAMWLRLALRGDAVYLPEALAAYRLHEKNLTHDFYRDGSVLAEKRALWDALRGYPEFRAELETSLRPLLRQMRWDLVKVRMNGASWRDSLRLSRSLDVAGGSRAGKTALLLALACPPAVLQAGYRTMKYVRGEAAWA